MTRKTGAASPSHLCALVAGGLVVLVPPAVSVGQETPGLGESGRTADAAAVTLCPGPERPLISSREVMSTPAIDEPPARSSFRDPVFGTCLVRVTDRDADLSADDASGGMTNEYSRVQAFNADGSRLLARGTEGTWYLYDAATLRPLGELPLGSEPRWDPDDPDGIAYVDEVRLMRYDLVSGESELVHDFGDAVPGTELASVSTRFEGRPSRDHRFWGLIALDTGWSEAAFLLYDARLERVVARRDLRGLPGVETGIDHVTMSPLGTWFVAAFDEYCDEGVLGSDARPCGLMVYDRSLSNGRSLLRVIGHYDTALDAAGREVIVYQDIDEDAIALLDLETGQRTILWPIDFGYTALGLHFSGCAYDRPGWAVVSTHDEDAASHTWMDDEVFALELRPGGRIARLAHTHSVTLEETEGAYWAEPHATASRDLARVVFSTNWGRVNTEQVEMYLIDLPSDWPDRLR